MLPLPTRTVTYRSAVEAEPGEGRTFTDLATVPAHIGRPSGSERMAPGGGTSTVDAVCWSELVDLPEGVTAGGQVADHLTGDVWEIISVFHQRGLGLDHTRAQLRATVGVA
jgi:hypothetical protein